MKPIFRRLFVLFVAALLVAALAACGAVNTDNPGDAGEDATTAVGDDPNGATDGEATEPEATEPEATEPEATEPEATTGCAHVWDEGVVAVEPDCSKTGLLRLTCTVCGEQKVENIPKTDDHKLSFSYLAVEPTATKAGERAGLCSRCGRIGYVPDTTTYASYQSKISTAKQKINAFTDSQFGSKAHGTMSTTAYSDPLAYPSEGQHPRLLFNKNTIGAVRAVLNDPANSDKLRSLIGTANDYTSGVPSGNTQGYENEDYREEILQTIRTKAFLYQMTGVKLYGYDAIRMMKEFMTGFKIADTSDPCRRYGEIMTTTAQVYDWCNDLLTSSDKEQFLRGVQYKLGPNMEVGFPPSKQGAVSGHGCERQILRDYLSIALAVYDDESSWYKYIAGRVYQEYVPVRNEYYTAGYYPQGISTYLPIRFGSDLWSAWLLSVATGSFPYNRTNMQKVMRTAYEHVVYSVAGNSGTQIFSEGDHQGRSGKEALKQLALPSMISAYLFNDPVAMSWADYADYSYFPTTYYMILKSKGTTGSAAKRYDGLDPIVYNGGWLGQMIAHNSFDTDGASVYMKIGNRMTANHDHADSGSFQIYYKALLAGDSGYYDKYESDHHKNYHQATIAHNSIVLKNGNTIVGQKQPSETTSFSTWKTGSNYQMGTTTGYAYGYSDAAKTKPTYAYLAGDIADAYIVPALSIGGFSFGSTTYLERCDRRMLAVYETGNARSPLFFFVYDNITSKDSKYQKVFLLHTITEPTISGKKATVVNGSGKLVLQNVAGDCTLSKVGGAKPANWTVGSKTYGLISSKSDKTDGYWGRLEVATPSGSKNNVMLNVTYVCDKNNDPNLTATAITNSSAATGAVIGKVAAVFADGASRQTSSFSFTTSGSGTLTYYVSGVGAGKWTVKVGSNTQTVTATEDGGLLVFTAPAGSVTLAPQ